MLDILTVILPIYLLIGLGFVSVWREWLPKESVAGFGIFVRNFALPCAIFLVVAQRDLTEVLHPGFMLAFAVASLLSFTVSYSFARRVAGHAASMVGILALAGSMSNGLMIGIPLITGLFGVSALSVIAQQLVIENALVLPLGLALAELGRAQEQEQEQAQMLAQALAQKKAQGPASTTVGRAPRSGLASRLGSVMRKTAFRVVTNPLIAALLLGLLVSLLNLPLPEAMVRSIDLLAASVGGMALVFIGAMLYGTDLRAALRGVMAAIAVKSAFHPLAMALSFWGVMLLWQAMGWLPIPPVYINASIIIATLPTIGVLPAVAAGFGHGRSISLAVLVMTVISMVTTPLTVWLLLTYQPFA